METFIITTDLQNVGMREGEEVTWGFVTDKEGEYVATVPLLRVEREDEWRKLAAEAIQAEGFTLVGDWSGTDELTATVAR